MVSSGPRVEISTGKLAGRREDGLEVYRGIPFAAAPVGANRFRPPMPPQAWTGLRDATLPAAICPQSPSRLSYAMGDVAAAQDEDCLTVTVWTPSADGARRPVLVWLHGGAYVSGAGALDWYSGAKLAREGDLVVVAVNYRLGALGWLHHDGIASGNLGLLDQHAALQWVKDNIAAFGGDPGNVTLWGQSAGAQSIAFLLMRPTSRGLFHRIILQSGPLGAPPRSAADATLLADGLLSELGIATSPGALQRLQQVPVAALLKAQGAVAQRLAAESQHKGRALLPIGPVADGTILPKRADYDAALKDAAGHVDVLIGTTREEMAIFFAANPAMQNLQSAPLAPDELARLQARRAGGTPAQLFADFVGERTFVAGSLAWAERAAAAGRRTFVYQFDWSSPDRRLAACHCLDLPFVFGTREAFATAPMLAGADAREIDALSAVMRASWIAFARTGDPSHRALPSWPAFDERRRATMHFAEVCQVNSDARMEGAP
jgi:para-nitrobenzyl esterase